MRIFRVSTFMYLLVASLAGATISPAVAGGSQIVISSPQTSTVIERSNPVIIDGRWENVPTCQTGGNYLTVKIVGAPADYKGYDYNYGSLTYRKVDLNIDENLDSYWMSPQSGPEGGANYDFSVKISRAYSGQTFHLSISTKGWAPGSYPVIISGGSLTFSPEDCGPITPASMTIVIPPLISPKVICKVNSSAPIREGDDVSADCSTDISLPSLPLTIQTNTSGLWVDTGKQLLADGFTFRVPSIPTTELGGTSLRLTSNGYPDKIAAFSSDIFAYQVSPKLAAAELGIALKKFVSNGPMTIEFVGSQALNPGLQLILKRSIAPAGPWTVEKTFQSGTIRTYDVNFPKGTWLQLTNTPNEQFVSTDSEPIQLLEKPKITCSITSRVEVGKKTTGTCMSSLSLKKTSVGIEINDSSDWIEIGKGSFSGKSNTFYITPASSGSFSLRINSAGLSGQYAGFSSNVMKLQVAGKPTRTSGSNQTPKGKVDKTSNAYKTMFKVGKNFVKVSLAGDTASSQCYSALKSGMIRANGNPQYLGVQARMIQSYLQTASGFQGCLDGYGQ